MKEMSKILKEGRPSMIGRLNVSFIFMFLMAAAILTSCSLEKPKSAEKDSPVKTETITQTRESQSQVTPEQAVAMLKDGNARFTSETMINRDLIAQVKQTGSGQYPFAAVVSCVDSRIPTEIVFDQGIGDIFNARIAGNFVNTDIIGSLEFATKVAGSKAIIVLGHTECGAVKGACDHVKLGNLTATLSNILPAVEGVTGITENRTSKNAEFVQKVADLNVELAIEKIKSESVVLNEMFKNGEIAIVGAMYDVHTGKVTFMN
jgi:carbonic anhydrase